MATDFVTCLKFFNKVASVALQDSKAGQLRIATANKYYNMVSADNIVLAATPIILEMQTHIKSRNINVVKNTDLWRKVAANANIEFDESFADTLKMTFSVWEMCDVQLQAKCWETLDKMVDIVLYLKK